MAEQVILVRHGHSFGNEQNREDPAYVQGPRSGLHERGRRQIEWSAGELVRHIIDQAVIPPTVIYTADMSRLVESAAIFQNTLRERLGLSLPIHMIPELAEKREPLELEDKTGAEIAASPRLIAIAEMVRRRHLDTEFSGQNGLDADGFETWQQKFSRVSLKLREIVPIDVEPLFVTSNGPASIIKAQLEHNLNLVLRTGGPPETGVITPQQLFDDYLFAVGNAEGLAYRRDMENGWNQTVNWRPQ